MKLIKTRIFTSEFKRKIWNKSKKYRQFCSFILILFV